MQEDKRETTAAAEATRMRPVDPSELAGVEGGLNPCPGESPDRLTENVTLNFAYVDKASTF